MLLSNLTISHSSVYANDVCDLISIINQSFCTKLWLFCTQVRVAFAKPPDPTLPTHLDCAYAAWVLNINPALFSLHLSSCFFPDGSPVYSRKPATGAWQHVRLKQEVCWQLASTVRRQGGDAGGWTATPGQITHHSQRGARVMFGEPKLQTSFPIVFLSFQQNLGFLGTSGYMFWKLVVWMVGRNFLDAVSSYLSF